MSRSNFKVICHRLVGVWVLWMLLIFTYSYPESKRFQSSSKSDKISKLTVLTDISCQIFTFLLFFTNSCSVPKTEQVYQISSKSDKISKITVFNRYYWSNIQIVTFVFANSCSVPKTEQVYQISSKSVMI